jgi:hypothetical protein
MAERDLRGTWTPGKKVNKTFSPLIGMVYEGQDKFFGNVEVGVLVELHEDNNEAVLRTKDQKVVSVDKKSLKFVVSS